MSGIQNTSRRWMSFVDGENLTFRAQSSAGMYLREGHYYKKDQYVWFSGWPATSPIGYMKVFLDAHAIRASYYTSVAGDDPAIDAARRVIWSMGFSAYVFKKTRQEQKAKGVDIALTKDMLAHAFRGNYDVAVLYAGDGDYVPLVEEVKSLGKCVYVHFFADGLNQNLKLVADGFWDITNDFVTQWTNSPSANPRCE